MKKKNPYYDTAAYGYLCFGEGAAEAIASRDLSKEGKDAEVRKAVRRAANFFYNGHEYNDWEVEIRDISECVMHILTDNHFFPPYTAKMKKYMKDRYEGLEPEACCEDEARWLSSPDEEEYRRQFLKAGKEQETPVSYKTDVMKRIQDHMWRPICRNANGENAQPEKTPAQALIWKFHREMLEIFENMGIYMRHEGKVSDFERLIQFLYHRPRAAFVDPKYMQPGADLTLVWQKYQEMEVLIERLDTMRYAQTTLKEDAHPVPKVLRPLLENIPCSEIFAPCISEPLKKRVHVVTLWDFYAHTPMEILKAISWKYRAVLTKRLVHMGIWYMPENEWR